MSFRSNILDSSKQFSHPRNMFIELRSGAISTEKRLSELRVIGTNAHMDNSSFLYLTMQGRFQDFFQGVAEISSGGGENLPGVAKKI